jgi:predicted DNA-binding protein YlxM (UPF0122 family)
VAELVAIKPEPSVAQLAERFQVHRTTVMDHVERAGVRRDYRLLVTAQIEEAARLYLAGWSLERLGQHFSVSDGTILNAFRRQGIATRPRQGERESIGGSA